MLKFKWLDGDVRFFFKISYHSEHVTIVLHVNIVMSACWHGYLAMSTHLIEKITSTKGAQKYVTINLASFFTSTFGEFQTGLIKKNCLWFSGNSKRGRIVSLPGRDHLPCPALYSLWGTGSQTTPPTYLFTSHTCVIFLLVNLSYVSSEFRAIELLIGPLFSPCVHDFW